MLKYILQRTRKPQVSYVCHSMGCTSFIISIDQYPELNAVIRKAVFMAPATYMEHVRNAVKLLRFFIGPDRLWVFSFLVLTNSVKSAIVSLTLVTICFLHSF